MHLWIIDVGSGFRGVRRSVKMAADGAGFTQARRSSSASQIAQSSAHTTSQSPAHTTAQCPAHTTGGHVSSRRRFGREFNGVGDVVGASVEFHAHSVGLLFFFDLKRVSD